MPIEKPYTIQFDYHEKYLSALVTGDKDSLEVSLMFWQEIFDESESKKYKRILISENFRNDISAIDMYILGEKLIELAPKNISVAFVDEQIQQLEMNKFTETVVYNRGGKGKAFADKKEAIKWLLEQED
jgi:3-dehydroquinate synthetase